MARPQNLVHGTVRGYNWYKCRCPLCKKAISDYGKERRQAKHAELGGDPEQKPYDYKPVDCGTYSGYATHKRRNEVPCEACTIARDDYLRDYRAGIRRRTHAGLKN